MVLKSYEQFSAAGWEAVLENVKKRVRRKVTGNALRINKIKDYYLQTSSKAAVKRIQRINQNLSVLLTIIMINEPYGKHVGDHKVKLRKSSKFTHAANLLVNSTDSSEEEIKANFETLVTSNRLEASVEGNDDDKKGKKMKRQNRIIAEN